MRAYAWARRGADVDAQQRRIEAGKGMPVLAETGCVHWRRTGELADPTTSAVCRMPAASHVVRVSKRIQ